MEARPSNLHRTREERCGAVCPARLCVFSLPRNPLTRGQVRVRPRCAGAAAVGKQPRGTSVSSSSSSSPPCVGGRACLPLPAGSSDFAAGCMRSGCRLLASLPAPAVGRDRYSTHTHPRCRHSAQVVVLFVLPSRCGGLIPSYLAVVGVEIRCSTRRPLQYCLLAEEGDLLLSGGRVCCCWPVAAGT